MMYAEKLAVALKSAGKVLREFKDTVYVPYGTEYSILIKNLNTVRASVTVTVDGTDATEGVSLIVNANSEISLDRFIKNGNLSSGNCFKFIERTAGIEQHRGIGIEDGLIRIEFEFEREPVYINRNDSFYRKLCDGPFYGGMYDNSRYGTCDAVATRGLQSSARSGEGQLMNTVTASSLTTSSVGQATNDVGITVPGSVSTQTFSTTYGFNGTGVKHAMVLKLLGETAVGTPVVVPVTVKAKPKCVSCGKVNKATSKFCSSCGTSLVIV